MTEMERLGQRTRREALGLTQLELANLVGVREETMRKWETGRSGLHAVSARAWDRALTDAEAASVKVG